MTRTTASSLLYFLFYSVLGWCYEVFLEVVVYRWGFSNRGFLFGPYCIVYGVGALLLLFTLGGLKKKKIRLGPLPNCGNHHRRGAGGQLPDGMGNRQLDVGLHPVRLSFSGENRPQSQPSVRRGRDGHPLPPASSPRADGSADPPPSPEKAGVGRGSPPGGRRRLPPSAFLTIVVPGFFGWER